MGGLIAGCPAPPPDGNGGVTPPPGTLAPGLVITVDKITIPTDLRPEVIFRLEDSQGNPIAFAELTDARFILGYLEEPETGSTARWLSYTLQPAGADGLTQATYDGARLNGITRNNNGSFTYKFTTPLPANFDASAAHQLAGQFQRLYPVDGEVYPFNLVHRFYPDGRTATAIPGRDIVNTETCNTCHTRLEFHGGARREVQLCIMCHNTQSVDPDTGNTVDFPTLIHKIHRGVGLPSVQDGEPYQIVGFGNSVHDYSDVVFPQDIRNCQVCHTDAPDADVHLERPTLEGCASCHDRTWFGSPDATPAGYQNHTGGAHQDNSLCTLCHKPTAPASSPIREAHLIPTESSAAPGLDFTILDVQSAVVEGGYTVSIIFEALNGDGLRIPDLSVLSSVAATVAWPATDYQRNVREVIGGGTSVPAGTLIAHANGTHTYRFAAAFPATGDTFAVAMEGRRNFTFRDASVQQGTSSNGQVFFTLDGSEPMMRRAIIDDTKCNACHGEIRAHGSQRFGTNYCVMCHHVNATDAARRPADAFPPETVNFKDMIHGIHTGEELNMPLTIFGFGNTAHDFTHVRFPGQRQECSICHVDGSTSLPLPEGTAATTVRVDGEVVSEVMPARAACTSCHDSFLADVHSVLQTDLATGFESCALCHGDNADFAVQLVHRLAP
jgi:OmcA/MtrC family decaheme c-type cytochrome